MSVWSRQLKGVSVEIISISEMKHNFCVDADRYKQKGVSENLIADRINRNLRSLHLLVNSPIHPGLFDPMQTQ